MSTSEMFTQGDDQSSENTEPMFIGEGKKYQDVSAADKALAFNDDHIKKIELENAEMRTKLEVAKNVDDILQSIQTQQTVLDTTLPTEEENHQNVDVDALVTKAVNDRMVQAKEEQVQLDNSQAVATELEKKFGGKAKEMYLSKAQELGVDLDDLARKSPTAVLAFFAESQQRSDSYMSSSINTASLVGSNTDHGTLEYWDKLHKEGKISRDEKFKQQHTWLEKLGATAFYGK